MYEITGIPYVTHCEHLADQELLQQVHREMLQKEARKERASAAEHKRLEQSMQQQCRTIVREELNQQRDAYQPPVTMYPNAPELGATLEESEAICSHQGGKQGSVPTAQNTVGGIEHSCRLGEDILYSAHSANHSITLDSISIFYRGADIGELRNELATRWGTPQETTITDGFRSWRWETANTSASLKVHSDYILLFLEAKLPPKGHSSPKADSNSTLSVPSRQSLLSHPGLTVVHTEH